MKTHPLLGTFTAILGSLSLLTISELKAPSYSFERFDPCSPTVDLNNPGWCNFPAETYGITIYQIAICRSNPLATSTPDTSSCFFLYNNSSGQYIDVANYLNSGITLNTLNKDERPPNGDYDYVYGLLSNRVNIKGSVTIKRGTYYTTSIRNPFVTGGSTIAEGTYEGSVASELRSNYSIFESPMWSDADEDNKPTCFWNGISHLNSNGQPATLDSNICSGATRIAQAAPSEELLGRTLRITDDVKGLDMKFGTSGALILSVYNENLVINFNGFDFSIDILR